MTALHIRDVPEATVLAFKRRAARRGHSVQQELREALARAAQDPVETDLPRDLRLQTVSTGHSEPFDRDDFYGDDER